MHHACWCLCFHSLLSHVYFSAHTSFREYVFTCVNLWVSGCLLFRYCVNVFRSHQLVCHRVNIHHAFLVFCYVFSRVCIAIVMVFACLCMHVSCISSYHVSSACVCQCLFLLSCASGGILRCLRVNFCPFLYSWSGCVHVHMHVHACFSKAIPAYSRLRCHGAIYGWRTKCPRCSQISGSFISSDHTVLILSFLFLAFLSAWCTHFP